MTDQTTCKNCDKQFDPGFAYCPHCGQKSGDDLTIGVLFSNTISNYFSVDARFFRSFLPLMFKPGVLARRFVDGRRQVYLHPAQFYLFISVIFFFLFSIITRKQQLDVDQALQKGFEAEMVNDTIPKKELTKADSLRIDKVTDVLKQNQKFTGMKDEDIEVLDSVMKTDQNAPNLSFSFNRQKLDSLIAAGASKEEKLKVIGLEEDDGAFKRLFVSQILKFYEQKGGGILKAFYDTIPIAIFFLLPLFALLLKIFYYRKGRFAHHMVFGFYFFTFLFVVFTVLILANFIFDIPGWIETLVILSTFIYLVLSLRNFYREHMLLALFKGGVISFSYLMIVLPISLFFMAMISFLVY